MVRAILSRNRSANYALVSLPAKVRDAGSAACFSNPTATLRPNYLTSSDASSWRFLFALASLFAQRLR